MKKKQNIKRSKGYNIYGQRCEVRTVTLNKETALKQYIEILDEIEIARAEGRKLEYTVYYSGMTKDEINSVMDFVTRLLTMRGMCA